MVRIFYYIYGLGLCCLTPLSTIFQLYRGGLFNTLCWGGGLFSILFGRIVPFLAQLSSLVSTSSYKISVKKYNLFITHITYLKI